MSLTSVDNKTLLLQAEVGAAAVSAAAEAAPRGGELPSGAEAIAKAFLPVEAQRLAFLRPPLPPLTEAELPPAAKQRYAELGSLCVPRRP